MLFSQYLLDCKPKHGKSSRGLQREKNLDDVTIEDAVKRDNLYELDELDRLSYKTMITQFAQTNPSDGVLVMFVCRL